MALPGSALAERYVVVEEKVLVASPADLAWSRIGGFCDIAKFTDVSCTITNGAGEVGAERQINGLPTEELMVGKTDRSYTYQGIARDIDFHGTLAVAAEGTGSVVTYTIVYDEEAIAPEKRAERRQRYIAGLVKTMPRIKLIAEGSPPAPH